MKLVPLVALVVLALVVAAPAAAESLPLPAEPPDFVDRYIVGHPVETPDFVDRFVVAESQRTPDFVDRFVARETAQPTISTTATASTSDNGRPLELAALIAVAAAMLGTVAVALRRRVPQPA